MLLGLSSEKIYNTNILEREADYFNEQNVKMRAFDY